MAKKTTYIIKVGIRYQGATVDKGEAFSRAATLYEAGRDVHVWSRPYGKGLHPLVEEDFLGDGSCTDG